MSFEQIKKLLEGNEDALKIVGDLESSQTQLVSRLNVLEVDSKAAFQKRDELKQKLNLVKTKFGIDEIDEDNLSKIGKKTDDAELNNLKSLLDKTSKEKQEIENSYKSKLSNLALKTELTKTGLAQKAINQEVYGILEGLALDGAYYDDSGTISFKNADGSTTYVNGKPMTLEDKVKMLEQSEAYKPLFRPVGVGGTGANPNSNGTQTKTSSLGQTKEERLNAIKNKFNLKG